MEKVEEVKELMLGMLKELNEIQLVEVAESLSLTIKEEKKSKKESLRNLILRHLTSEDVEDSPDEGLALYKTVSEKLTSMLVAAYEEKEKLAEIKDAVSGSSHMNKLEIRLKEEDEAEKYNNEKLRTLDTLLDQLTKVKLEAGGLEKVKGKNNPLENLMFKSLLGKGKQKDSEEDDSEDDEDEDRRRLLQQRKGEKKELRRMKLKDFKIDGGVVGGEKNALDYCSLRFQMDEGIEAGYLKKEVRTGVIKAIKAGTTTRRYFERNARDMTHKEFLKTLSELYDNSDTNDLIDEMCERVQGKGESEREYLMAMFELRDNIIEATKTDEEPLGTSFVQKRMLRAISVGIRKDTVRLEMKDALKDTSKTDSELLEEVNSVVARDTENRKKMGKGNATVNALSGFSDNEGKPKSQDPESKERTRSGTTSKMGVSFKDKPAGSKEDPAIASVLAVVSLLQADLQEQTKSMVALQKQVAELVTKVNNNSNNRQSPQGDRKFLKCENCERTNSFCTHCTKCNEGGHKRFNCPKNR